jgi:threonine/homoserine/homoserine lactone efflux protein
MQRHGLATGSLTMPEQDAYIAFLGALLAYQLAGPGPDMILVITRGVAQGRRTALATAVGCVSAGFIQIPLLAFGLASIINASPLAHEILRWTGAAYLVFIGVRLLISSRRSWAAEDPLVDRASLGAALRQGLISNLTNPQTLAFMLALLPQFVTPGAGSVTQLVVLGLTMKGVGLLVLGSVALAAGSVGGWISRRPRLMAWQGGFAGVAMIGLACYMAFGNGTPRKS